MRQIAKAMHLNLKYPEAMSLLHAAQQAIAHTNPAVMVTVVGSRGSAPRHAGAAMLVTTHSVVGTVGGGHLEWVAIERARGSAEFSAQFPAEHEYPLGAALGQCCGGAMTLRFEPLSAVHITVLQAQIATFKTLFLFGAGHVAQALVPLLAPLPLRIVWADARDAVNTHQMTFPQGLPAHIAALVSDTLEAELGAAKQGDMALIMTHSHALDEVLTQAALKTPALAYIGLIGSATKRRLFEQRLSQKSLTSRDFSRLTCPIGIVSRPTEHSKLPAVIATQVAAQLLEYL